MDRKACHLLDARNRAGIHPFLLHHFAAARQDSRRAVAGAREPDKAMPAHQRIHSDWGKPVDYRVEYRCRSI